MISNRLSNTAILALLFSLSSAHPLHAHVDNVPKVPPATANLNVKAPNFILLNQEGARFDSSKLVGKVIAIDFIYTTCTDVCPLFTAHFAELQRMLANKHGPDVFFASITTDPEVDSPKVLKAYAQRYGVDFRNWAFLTGAEEQLKPVWNAFGIRVVKKGRGLVQHTSLTTLIDKEGIRRFNFFGEKWQTQDVLNDILTLLRQKGGRDH